MKLKNIRNYTHQELQDVLTQVKAELQLGKSMMKRLSY